jgi:hypothetical protein
MIVEVTTFGLAPGVTDEAFLAADRRVQTEVVPNQRGFLRRTTARRGVHWLVVTLWATDADAAFFEAVAATLPVHQEFEALCDPASRTTSRYETLD